MDPVGGNPLFRLPFGVADKQFYFLPQDSPRGIDLLRCQFGRIGDPLAHGHLYGGQHPDPHGVDLGEIPVAGSPAELLARHAQPATQADDEIKRQDAEQQARGQEQIRGMTAMTALLTTYMPPQIEWRPVLRLFHITMTCS
jgi:hypothetical protein